MATNPTGEPTDDVSVEEVAAKRRGQRKPRQPTAPAGPLPEPVAGEIPGTVVVSRALVAEHMGYTGPARPRGGTFGAEPAIMPPDRPLGAMYPDRPGWVTAECDAHESMTPPGCHTPVSRVLWLKGWKVRRDVYEKALAEHATDVAAGTAGVAKPARLPAGIDDPPAVALQVTSTQG